MISVKKHRLGYAIQLPNVWAADVMVTEDEARNLTAALVAAQASAEMPGEAPTCRSCGKSKTLNAFRRCAGCQALEDDYRREAQLPPEVAPPCSHERGQWPIYVWVDEPNSRRCTICFPSSPAERAAFQANLREKKSCSIDSGAGSARTTTRSTSPDSAPRNPAATDAGPADDAAKSVATAPERAADGSGEADTGRPPLTHVAIRFEGKVWSLPRPYRHHHIIRVIRSLDSTIESVDTYGDDQGFLDATGRYLSRKQARVSAEVNGQINNGKIIGGELTSEDMW